MHWGLTGTLVTNCLEDIPMVVGGGLENPRVTAGGKQSSPWSDLRLEFSSPSQITSHSVVGGCQQFLKV